MTRPAKTARLVEQEALDLVHALFSPERRLTEPTRALRASKELSDLIDLLTIDAVRQARKGFVTWADIGDALCVTKQAAHQQFGVLVEDAPSPASSVAGGAGAGPKHLADGSASQDQ